jgi:Phosphotransferase enzyme family
MPVRVHFRQTHLSVVTGVRLADGRNVVIKARPATARQHGCLEIQRHLWQAGFPCPQPLAGPAPLAALDAVAEAFVPGGTQLAPGPGFAASFAAALAGLIRLTPPVAAVPALDPPPPWCYWDHREPGPWPWPDDLDADLNAHPGPAWLDDAAIRVRSRLARYAGPSVAGHSDWESQNIRWHRGRLHVVHDWDSIVSGPEAAIAGLAAAVFAAGGDPGDPGQHATVAQGEQFLAAYERARGRPWTADEREVAWASGAWVTAFNAKKDTVRGGPPAQALAAEIADRLRRARA